MILTGSVWERTAYTKGYGENRRKTAFVFQNYNSFRNKTALENVTEVIVARRPKDDEAIKIENRFLIRWAFDRYGYYLTRCPAASSSGGHRPRHWQRTRR